MPEEARKWVRHGAFRTDPDGPNTAYEPPEILDTATYAALDDDAINIDHICDHTEKLMSTMTLGEKLFYERCTVCHGPRDPAQYTKLQWKGISESMYPRAGLEPEEASTITQFLEANAKDAAN